MSMREVLIEAGARALCIADGRDPDEMVFGGQATAFDNYGELWQANRQSGGMLGVTDYAGDAEQAVDAILAKLMQPTKAMIEAAWPSPVRFTNPSAIRTLNRNTVNRWQAMVRSIVEGVA